MKILLWIVIVLAVAQLAFAAYVRLAPEDPARWHIDLADLGPRPDNAAVFCPTPGTRLSSGTADAPDLAALDAIAMAWPRTARLAGSVADGHITYVTRTRLMAFPDYTTVQIVEWPGPSDEGEAGERVVDLCIVARQRYGLQDGGVNAARVQAWVQELYGLDEAPDLAAPSE